MHNCSETKEKLLNFVFGEMTANERARFEREIKFCAACQTERLATEKTLQMLDAAGENLEPSQREWQVYETNLLKNFAAQHKPQTIWSTIFVRIFCSSVRVPSPVFAAALLICGAFAFFAVRSFRSTAENSPPSAATVQPSSPERITEKVIEKPIEKVVVQTVEKVVVRDRIVRQKVFVTREIKNPIETSVQNRAEILIARTVKISNKNLNQLNLAEFKPIVNQAPNVQKVVQPKLETPKVEPEHEK